MPSEVETQVTLKKLLPQKPEVGRTLVCEGDSLRLVGAGVPATGGADFLEAGAGLYSRYARPIIQKNVQSRVSV